MALIMEQCKNMKDKLEDILGNESISIGGREVLLIQLFQVSEETVSTDMMQQAAIYARIGSIKVRKESERNVAKQRKEEVYAALDLAYRAEFDNNRKKYTEAEIKANVITDQQYVDVQQALYDAEENFALFELLTRALEMRANMLQSIGAYLRMENSMTGMNIRQYEETIANMKERLKK